MGLVLIVLLSTIVPAQGAPSVPTTTTYTLIGYVYQPQNGTIAPNPALAGTQVDLVSQATNQTYTTTTGANGIPGQFRFSSLTNAPSLAQGWWGVWVPTQANVSLPKCSPCAVAPRVSTPVFNYITSSNLTSGGATVNIQNVSYLQYSDLLNGTVRSAGRPVTALVQVLDPRYSDFVLASAVTRGNGTYLLPVPHGTWTVESSLIGPSPRYNLTRVTVSQAQQWLNISLNSYLISGYENTIVNGLPVPVPTGGNVTVFDPTTGAVYTSTISGGFYSFGTYPANFTGGPTSYDVFLSSFNYTTAYYTQTVSSAGPISKSVVVSAQSPPASYVTTLNFTGSNIVSGSANLGVTTSAKLGPNAVIPSLENASVGDLWSQIGLDYNRSVNASASWVPTVAKVINSGGPFFAADQSDATINGTTFNTPANTPPGYKFSYSTNCVAVCGPTSNASIFLNYSASYQLSSTLYGNSSIYAFSFQFRYPTHQQSFVYDVQLPKGYTLQASTPAPADSQLAPTGEGHTWTSFTLTPQPNSPTTYGTFSFNAIKYGGVHAVVNASTTNFAFSTANVLNLTSGNYTVVVGQRQNVTFSALNSTYPTDTNGSFYVWNLGDGNHTSSAQATTYQYYNASSLLNRRLEGNLTVTNSGGQKNEVNFFLWVVPNGLVRANISTNASASEQGTSGGVPYLIVNYTTPIQLNATGSIANNGAPGVPSVVSIAQWNWTVYGYTNSANRFSAANKQSPIFTNWSLIPTGIGRYYVNTTIGGQTVAFFGWRYNVTLTIFDGAGHQNSTTLAVLVRDTQRPVPRIAIVNPRGSTGAGQNVSASGVIENNVPGLTNGTAKVLFYGNYSYDPANGSIPRYLWHINNTYNNTKGTDFWFNQSAVAPSYGYPGPLTLWLTPQVKAYTVNLTVWDLAGNVYWATQSLMVNVNTTTRPIMAANNLTAPATMTAGTSYTIWVNVTVDGGTKAVATNVRVTFYLLPPSGTGSPNYFVSNTVVQFYNYTSTNVANSTPIPGSGGGVLPTLAYGKTVRAVITWTPGPTGISLLGGGNIGTWYLYANATASNEFAPDYHGGPNLISTRITVVQNPLSTYLTIGIIVGVIIVIVAVLVIIYRRRRSPRRGARGRGGLERGARRRRDAEESK